MGVGEMKRVGARRRYGQAGKGKSRRVSGSPSSIQGVSGSPFSVSRLKAMAGQEDVEFTKLRYETTSAFTLTGGTASFITVKGNSIYRPYGSNTDSPSGSQRLYTQYARSLVLGSRVEVRLWSNTSAGVQQPFRMAVVPCTAVNLITYSGYANISSLRGVPHSSEKLFSPGATLPTLRSSGTNAQLLFGSRFETGSEVLSGTTYAGESGVDPTTLWYHLIGLQAMAGTTSLDSQLQVMIEFDVMFFRPVATPAQFLNWHGNEEVVEAKASRDDEKQIRIPYSKSAIDLRSPITTRTIDGVEYEMVQYGPTLSQQRKS